MTAWMLLYIGDLRVQKSEWVVDRIKLLHLMLVWWGLDLGTRLSLPHSLSLSLSLSLSFSLSLSLSTRSPGMTESVDLDFKR